MTEPAATAAAGAPAMTPGTRLAQARIAHGLSVEGVAQQLKFSPSQIEALEGDRYEELPGVAAVRGMVRGYARLVRVDAAPLLEALRDVVPAPDAGRIVARYKEPVPFSDASKRSNVVYVVFTLAVLAVATLVLVQWRQERPQPAPMTFVAPAASSQAARTTVASAGGVPSARPALEAAAPAQPVAARDARGESEAASATAGDAKEGAAAPAQAADAAGGAATQSASAAGTSAAAAPPGPTPAAEAVHRIRIEFLEESWVEIRDGHGKLLHAQLNSAGSEVRVEGEAPLSFVIGNAQNVRLSYNGRSFDLTPYIRVAVARFKLP